MGRREPCGAGNVATHAGSRLQGHVTSRDAKQIRPLLRSDHGVDSSAARVACSHGSGGREGWAVAEARLSHQSNRVVSHPAQGRLVRYLVVALHGRLGASSRCRDASPYPLLHDRHSASPARFLGLGPRPWSGSTPWSGSFPWFGSIPLSGSLLRAAGMRWTDVRGESTACQKAGSRRCGGTIAGLPAGAGCATRRAANPGKPASATAAKRVRTARPRCPTTAAGAQGPPPLGLR